MKSMAKGKALLVIVRPKLLRLLSVPLELPPQTFMAP